MDDFEAFALRKAAHSIAAFGPRQTDEGILDHLKKEIEEVRKAERPKEKQREWVDIFMLGLDGLLRALIREGYPTSRAASEAVHMIRTKQTDLEGREWPDWRTVSPDKALRELADDAGSEIVHIDLDEPLPGLPNKIPTLLDRRAGRVLGVFDLFEKYRTRPAIKSGTAHVTAVESFIDLVNRHKTDNSALFADTDWTEPSLMAVIDYHQLANGGDADWLKHRIVYDFPLTDEWKAWVAQDGQPMDQASFAEWFEVHLPELSSPDSQEAEDFLANFGLKVAYPNEIMALTRGISVYVDTRVKNNVTLQSGEGEITFEENHTDGKGNKFTVPGLFILSIKPFKMGSACRIPVRLRYRVAAGGVVKWLFKMLRPEEYITQEILRDCERAASETGLPLYHGAPEA